jgi:hypothetical protein
MPRGESVLGDVHKSDDEGGGVGLEVRDRRYYDFCLRKGRGEDSGGGSRLLLLLLLLLLQPRPQRAARAAARGEAMMWLRRAMQKSEALHGRFTCCFLKRGVDGVRPLEHPCHDG